jgi:hypothetical protein
MKKLLLLDADVIIDLHTLDIFSDLAKSYELMATDVVVCEAKYYKRDGQNYPVDISEVVTIVEDIDIDTIRLVIEEKKLARLTVDDGEASSIAYIIQTHDVLFCTCDRAAISLCAFMDLENRAISLEGAFSKAGKKKMLLRRHSNKSFKESIKNGLALKVIHKLT